MAESRQILLVEDDKGHAELVRRSLEDAPFDVQLRVLQDGSQALAFLRREDAYRELADEPLPRLVLLDLRLPGLDGLGVLEELRATPRLRDLPIVVLSTSASEPDLEAAYRRRANGYLVKPLEFSALRSMLRQTVSYWLGWNRLPRSLRAEPPWAEPATGRDGGARGVSEGAECDPERSS